MTEVPLYDPSDTQRSQALDEAHECLIDAAWHIATEWWPDSPHAEAILGLLGSLEKVLDVLDGDTI